MSFKTKVKKAIAGVLLVGIANQVLLPVVYARKLYNVLSSSPANIVVENGDIDGWSDSSGDFSAFDYLNIASSVVHNGEVQEGVDCKDYSRAIFEVYQYLVRRNNRSDLSDKVRVCADFRKKNTSDGHVWIEYRDGSYVFPYETTKYTFVLSPDLVKAYSLVRRAIKQELNGAPLDNHEDNVVVRTVWGSKNPYPTLDSFLKKGGLVGFLLEEK